MGHTVSGSDIKSAAVLERLAAAGVDVHVGNRAEHVPADADAVVYSTAIPLRNVELVAAAERGIPVLHRSAALAALAATRKTIAVAGSHGKTTSASMLALILRSAGWSPSFVIGGEVNEVGSNAAFGEGEWLVVEADESDGTFLHLSPQAALVTNIEPDHLDHYGDFDALLRAFGEFAASVSGPLVVCADDREAARLASATVAASTRTFGYAPTADYRIVDEVVEAGECRFTLAWSNNAGGETRTAITVPAGVKASTNAAGAIAIALELGVDVEAAVRALAGFGGVARRFQYRGERDGVTFIDDYAHLPTEVDAAIAAAPGSVAPRRRRVPTAPLHAHRVDRAAVRRLVHRRRHVGADRRVPRGRDPDPGRVGPHDPAGGARPPSRAAGRVSPAARRPGRGSGAIRAPATSC